MGFDDLIDDSEEDREKSETEGLKNQLGVESKEELEDLDDRIGTLYETVMHLDKQVATLEDEIKMIRNSVAKMDDDMEEMKDNDT